MITKMIFVDLFEFEFQRKVSLVRIELEAFIVEISEMLSKQG